MDAGLVLRALAVRTRSDILACLSDGPLPVGVIASRVGRSVATVSAHITVLEDAGLVRVKRRGRIHPVTACFRSLSLHCE